jgi:Asp-tRNA(Asn)/Glu-tRNA(Gln) amidotransferase A subunit family amidase
MQSFDWGTDIGGSIRMPAAFCGVLGMRLSSETWPIEGLFPKLPKTLAWMCGQGPLTRTIEQMRAVLKVAAPGLRTGLPRSFKLEGAVIYAPDRAGDWPAFSTEVAAHLEATLDGLPLRELPLPSTTRVRNVYSSLWASHLEEILACDESISFAEGLGAVLSSIVFRGAFGDRRFHPTTAELLAIIALGRFTLFRDPKRALQKAAALREQFDALWSKGCVVVAPVCMYPAPPLGRLNWNPHVLSCTIPGNVVDATSVSIPFGRFEGGLPRGVQIMGPPGSEDIVLDLAERMIASRDQDPELAPLPPPS